MDHMVITAPNSARDKNTPPLTVAKACDASQNSIHTMLHAQRAKHTTDKTMARLIKK